MVHQEGRRVAQEHEYERDDQDGDAAELAKSTLLTLLTSVKFVILVFW